MENFDVFTLFMILFPAVFTLFIRVRPGTEEQRGTRRRLTLILWLATAAAVFAYLLLAAMLASTFATDTVAALEFPGPCPGIATAKFNDGRVVMQNEALRACCDFRRGRLGLVEIVDKLSGRTQHAKSPEAFVIESQPRTLPNSLPSPIFSLGPVL